MTFQYKARTYLHFDTPVSKAVAEKIAIDPILVARNPFLPFILTIAETQKIRKKEGGGVEKLPPKKRPIAYAGHKDAHIFSHYSSMLQDRYEELLAERGLGRAITAFRSIKASQGTPHRAGAPKESGCCNIDFANEAFEFIRTHLPCYVVASDISDFFNQINHEQLKTKWKSLIGVDRLPADHFAVFKAITKYSTVDREEMFKALGIDPDHPRAGGRYRICSPTQFREIVRGNGLCIPNKLGKGIPQGSPISAVLANIYMLEFDSTLHDFVSKHGGLYRRYCDDLLIVVPTAQLREEAKQLMLEGLQGLRLEAHPKKTESFDFPEDANCKPIAKPLNYLGFTFDGKNKRIRSSSIARYNKKMQRGVARAKAIRGRVHKDLAYWHWTPLRTRKLNILYSYIGRHNFPPG